MCGVGKVHVHGTGNPGGQIAGMRGRRQYVGAAADNDGVPADFAEGSVPVVVAQRGQESDGGGHGVASADAEAAPSSVNSATMQKCVVLFCSLR